MQGHDEAMSPTGWRDDELSDRRRAQRLCIEATERRAGRAARYSRWRACGASHARIGRRGGKRRLTWHAGVSSANTPGTAPSGARTWRAMGKGAPRRLRGGPDDPGRPFLETTRSRPTILKRRPRALRLATIGACSIASKICLQARGVSRVHDRLPRDAANPLPTAAPVSCCRDER